MSDYATVVDCYECRKLTSGRCAQHSQWVIGGIPAASGVAPCVLCDTWKATISRLQGENERLKGDGSVAFCSHCGWNQRYNMDDPGDQTHAAVMLALHVSRCEKHPLLIRAKAAERALAALREQVTQIEQLPKKWRGEKMNYSAWRCAEELADALASLVNETEKEKA